MFKYKRGDEILGYHVDTFCQYGDRDYAKVYNLLSSEIQNKTIEIQNAVDWHASMGSDDLKGIVVEIEKVTKDNYPKDYTLSR